jgi:hypothetical protein
MTLLYVACEAEAFDRLSDSVVEDAGAAFSIAPARSAIGVPNAQTMTTGPWLEGATCTDTAWVNCDVYYYGVDNGLFTLYTSANAAFFRLTQGSSFSKIVAQTSVDGTTWVTRGTEFTLPQTFRYTIVTKVKLNSASGTVDVWVGDTHPVSVTGIDLSAVTDFGSWGALGTASVKNYYSKLIIAANEDIRNWKITPYWPTGMGAMDDETGSYTDVNELALDESTAISFAANGNIGTFTHAATPLPTGHQVVGVVVSSKVRKGASGIANYEHVLRIGSTNYASANVAALDTAYHPRQSLWTIDPATSAAFVAVPAEFGGKGIT